MMHKDSIPLLLELSSDTQRRRPDGFDCAEIRDARCHKWEPRAADGSVAVENGKEATDRLLQDGLKTLTCSRSRRLDNGHSWLLLLVLEHLLALFLVSLVGHSVEDHVDEVLYRVHGHGLAGRVV